jgi:hypothetical protein
MYGKAIQTIMEKNAAAAPPPPPPVFDLAKSGNPNAATSESLASAFTDAPKGRPEAPIGELMPSPMFSNQQPGITAAMPVTGMLPTQGPMQNINTIQNPVSSSVIKGSSKVVS